MQLAQKESVLIWHSCQAKALRRGARCQRAPLFSSSSAQVVSRRQPFLTSETGSKMPRKSLNPCCTPPPRGSSARHAVPKRSFLLAITGAAWLGAAPANAEDVVEVPSKVLEYSDSLDQLKVRCLSANGL
jgi:hypothetical protein